MHPGRRSNGESKSKTEDKKVVYHPQALEELIDAAEYYDSCNPGLGARFLNYVEQALNFIRENPHVLRPDKRGRRKYIVKKFPYLLIYKVKEDCIYILAVAHGARKPGYWKSRDLDITR